MRSLLCKTSPPTPLLQREGRAYPTSPLVPLPRGEGNCSPFPCREGGQGVRFRGECNHSLLWFAVQTLVCLLFLLFALPSLAQVEAFRARIVLLPGGTVSLSVDGGARFTVIGRVVTLPQRLVSSQQPAATATPKSNGLWLLQHNEKEGVYLAAEGVRLPNALGTDIPLGSVLFRDRGAKVSARLMLQEGKVAYSMPPGYRYRLGDVWALQILAEDEAEAQAIREEVAAALPEESRQAAQRSIQRGEKAKLPVVNGTLNLEVTARYTETVKFVFFTVDGYLAGTSNVLPTIFRWDSTQFPDGEYLVEVRATDKDEREVALVRKRILVRNGTGR